MKRSYWPALLLLVALSTVGCAHCKGKKCSKFPSPCLSESGCGPITSAAPAMIGTPLPAYETMMVAPPTTTTTAPPASAAPSPFTVPQSQMTSTPAARTPTRSATGAGPVGGGSTARTPAATAAPAATPLTPPSDVPSPLSAPPISPPMP